MNSPHSSSREEHHPTDICCGAQLWPVDAEVDFARARPAKVVYKGGMGGYRLEQETEEVRLEIAARLFDVLCARLSGQDVTLVDGYGRVVVGSDQANVLVPP